MQVKYTKRLHDLQQEQFRRNQKVIQKAKRSNPHTNLQASGQFTMNNTFNKSNQSGGEGEEEFSPDLNDGPNRIQELVQAKQNKRAQEAMEAIRRAERIKEKQN